MNILNLIQNDWTLGGERFNGLAFLRKGSERILYDTLSQKELLRYTSSVGMKHWLMLKCFRRRIRLLWIVRVVLKRWLFRCCLVILF